MRKRTVFQILAAAAAATPAGLALAEDVGATPGEIRELTRPVAPGIANAGGAGKFRFATPGFGLGGPDADVDGAFLGGVFDPGDGVSWQNPANWTTNPQIPDGSAAIARFDGRANGASVTLGNTTVTLSRLDMNDPQLTTIVGGTLNLAGSGVVEANNNFFNPPGVIFSGVNNLGTATTSLNIGGSVGFTKTGNAPITLGNANTFTGPVNVNGGQLIITAGDTSLGNAANVVNLNNGTMDVRTANWETTRTINVGAGGGSVFYAGAGRTFVSSGDITGSGTLRINGGFGAPAAATFNSAKSYTGHLIVSAGTLNLDANNAVANASAVTSMGTLALSGGTNRIGDSTPVNLDGGVIRINGAETMGALNLVQSTSWVVVDSGVTQFASANRQNKATAAFRGDGLGGGSTQVRFTAAPALVGGLIPWAYGNAGGPFTPPESEGNTLVTYGANGVTPITTFVDINSATAGDNALVADAGATVNGAVNANALVLRVSDFYASTPMTLAGTGQINLTSGVVLSGNAGFDSSGTAINSSPGNIVNVNINAGANELIIHSPSAVTFNGVLSGSGGMTKSGGRTAFFNADNTYTGETNLTGFVRFNRNVPSGAPSPFGNSTTAVKLWSGNFAPINPGTNAANGSMTGILAADNNVGALTFARPLEVKGSGTGLLRNFATGALTMTGPITIDAGSALDIQMFGPAAGAGVSDQIIINSVISGGGGVQVSQLAQGGASPGAFVRFNNANTFTGGLDVSGAAAAGSLVQVGHNQGLGAGSVTMSNNATFEAAGAARNVSNPLFVVAGTLGFTGSNPFEWSGPIKGVGGDFVLNSTATANVTLSGVMTDGGGFFKTGSGTVVVSGNNTFNGILNVGNGTIEGGMVVLASNNAAGTRVGNTGVNSGQNAIGLPGGITIGDELIFLRGNGIGDLGALRNLAGTNTWGGRVQAASPNTVGVDAGQLNVGRSWFSVAPAGTLAGTAVARKVGTGVLQIGSEQFTATRSNGATSSFQGAIIANSLDVAAGIVRIQPSVGGNKRVSDVGSLTLGAGAQLDLTDNALVVDYDSAGPTPYADIRSKIVSAYNGGAWNGPGITSSNANASNFGLGYAEGTAVLTYSGTPADALFLGDVVDQSAVLVRFTRYGDANIDGQVNLADFNRLAANFGTGTRWDQGDFDYNGLVNLADFNRLAANFGLSAAGPEVTPDDWARLGAAVPEPSSLALAAVGAAAMLRRRRRA